MSFILDNIVKTRLALASFTLVCAAWCEQANEPAGVFDAGRIVVTVTDAAPQTPVAALVDAKTFRLRNAAKMPDALNLLAGVSLQRIGPRNERGVFVRGFDFRQVPLYIDGIPVYVPYDGYVDLDRFLTYDISEIQVAKGFTSPLYGPNAIGGAINLVSRAPMKRLDLDLGAGTGSGEMAEGFINAGSRWSKLWVQGGFAWLSSNNFPLSSAWRPVPLQPERERRNAYQTDYKTRFRFGWMANERDRVAFTYARQNGEKGNPPYAGGDRAVRPRFWRWPQWDKESFYLIGDKSLGGQRYLRVRTYYDKFNNLLKAFDDATYSTQRLPSSFTSPYDDDTYGVTAEMGLWVSRRHVFRQSVYFKDDTHREGNLGEPQRSFRDQSFSLGVEDTLRITGRTGTVLGFSADHLGVRNAENLIGGRVEPFPKTDVWAYNPQVGVFHNLSDTARLHLTFARKTRLPTIKDRYSYRLGQAIPNPFLREERSNNYEIGYTHVAGARAYWSAAVFRSDVSNVTQRFFLQPNLFQLRNLGEARYWGGEAQLRWSPVRWLQWQSSYTYLSRRNMTMPAIILLDAPRHKVYSSMVGLWGTRLTGTVDVLYEGGRWAANDAGRVARAPSFAVVNVNGRVRLWGSSAVQGGVGNLLDRNYYFVDGYPEAGRTFYLGLRSTF